MKINTLLQTWMIVVVSVLLAHAGFAQAPNGSISSPTFSGVQGIYDLTGVLTNLSVDFAASDGTPVPFNQRRQRGAVHDWRHNRNNDRNNLLGDGRRRHLQ